MNTTEYKTYYDNKKFTIRAGYTNGVVGIDITTVLYATHGVVYDNNTIGYDNPSAASTKAIRRAVNSIVERLTGKPALVNINIMNELKTYTDYYNL